MLKLAMPVWEKTVFVRVAGSSCAAAGWRSSRAGAWAKAKLGGVGREVERAVGVVVAMIDGWVGDGDANAPPATCSSDVGE